MLGAKCHFAHGDAELRKPEDPISMEQLKLALISVQWQNCNQGNRGRGGGMGRGGGRGNFRGNNNNRGSANGRGSFRGGGGGNQNGGRGGYNNNANGGTPGGGYSPNKQNTANPSLYKTVMCRHFQ